MKGLHRERFTKARGLGSTAKTGLPSLDDAVDDAARSDGCSCIAVDHDAANICIRNGAPGPVIDFLGTSLCSGLPQPDPASPTPWQLPGPPRQALPDHHVCRKLNSRRLSFHPASMVIQRANCFLATNAGAPRIHKVQPAVASPGEMVRYPYMEWAYAYGYSGEIRLIRLGNSTKRWHRRLPWVRWAERNDLNSMSVTQHGRPPSHARTCCNDSASACILCRA